MKTVQAVIGATFLFCFSCIANAYLVTDVVTINRTLDSGQFVAWTHDMTKYGFVPGNTITNSFTLTLELRDAEDAPWKEGWEDRPFYMISQGQGRTFGRVYMEDIVDAGGPVFIDDTGKARPRLEILEGKVWFGRSILSMDITPVTASSPLGLLLLGLAALALLRLRGARLGSNSFQ